MRTIPLSLGFAGALLPIATTDDGVDVVPLKPICDVFGLQWRSQFAKFGLKPGTCIPASRYAGSEKSTYYVRRLGLCVQEFNHAGQRREMLAIRVDRVAAYLNMLNPAMVKAKGNEQGAEFLIKKHEEWDDVIHDYEVAHGMFQQSELLQKSHLLRTARTLLAACREHRATEGQAERRMLEHVVAQFAAEVGVPYQPDLLDAGPKHAG